MSQVTVSERLREWVSDAREWFVEIALKYAFFALAGAFAAFFFKTKPGQLLFVKCPFADFFARGEAWLVKHGIQENEKPWDSDPVFGFFDFDTIASHSSEHCVQLSPGEAVTTTGERRRGKSWDINESAESAAYFYYVQVLSSHGLVWVEEVYLSHRS